MNARMSSPGQRLLWLAAMVLFLSTPAIAGRNADGALIVHTNDAVNFTPGGDYCGASFSNPGSCANANARTDKDEDHAAVIWVLAAFPTGSSPAVTAVQFGLDDNLPEGNWETWGKCRSGVLEIPDTGWPTTGKGTALAYTSAVTDTLFPIYWFAVDGFAGPPAAYLGTTNYTRGDSLAQFADDSNPPLTDNITHFGTVRWYQAGSNDCPGIGNDDEDDDAGDDGSSDSHGIDTTEDESPLFVYPTTDTEPFKRIDLRADLVDSAGCIVIRDAEQQDTLWSSHLIVRRNYQDTVGVVDNTKSIEYGRQSECGPAHIEFGVDPPRRATSLILLGSGDGVFQSNVGEPILTATVTFDDHSTLVDTARVGSHYREERAYHPMWPPHCDPFLFTRPTDPLAGEVWHGQFGSLPEDTGWLDVREFRLPPDSPTKRVTSVRLTPQICGVWCDSGGELAQAFLQSRATTSGISLGTNFRIGQGGAGITTQHQFDSAWGTEPFGGYKYHGQVIGTYQTIGRLGCLMTCYSMLSNYFGASCTPLAMHRYLQEHGGYEPHVGWEVVDIKGQAVGDTVQLSIKDPDYVFNVNDSPVIIRDSLGPFKPLATVRLYEWDGTLNGTISARFDTTAIVVHDKGVRFSEPNPLVAVAFGTDDGSALYTIDKVGANAEAIETGLGDGAPVVIKTKGGGHFVLADGMEPHLDAIHNNLRGTYSIHDPGHSNVTELVNPRYQNRIYEGRVMRAITGMREEVVPSGRLAFTFCGDGVLQLTGPTGTVTWDSAANDYVSTIPGALAFWHDALIAPDDTIPAVATDMIAIPRPDAGTYLVEVKGSIPGVFALTVAAHDASDSLRLTALDGMTSDVASSYYLIRYDPSPGSLIYVNEVEPAAVANGNLRVGPLHLMCSPNPAGPTSRVCWVLPRGGAARVDVFDVSGARVAKVLDGRFPAGMQSLQWNGADMRGRPLPNGVYFVRLTSEGESVTQKILMLR